MRWAREHAQPTRPTGGRGRGPRSAQLRATSCVDGDGRKGGSCVCVCLRAELGSGRTKEGNAPEGTKKGMCSLSDCILTGWTCKGREETSVRKSLKGAAAHSRAVIFVSLRAAAITKAPREAPRQCPSMLPARLRARGRMGIGERVGASMGADTKVNAFGRHAHPSEVTELPLLSASSSLVMPSTV